MEEEAIPLDNRFGYKEYTTKKKILKIWGFYNERFRQSWEKFTTDCDDLCSLYLSIAIFGEIICKYVSRKMLKVNCFNKKDCRKK